jgi:hypothetical protein
MMSDLMAENNLETHLGHSWVTCETAVHLDVALATVPVGDRIYGSVTPE